MNPAAIDPKLLIDLFIIITAGTGLGCVARLLRQPILVAYLIAGLVIGPVGFALISSSSDILMFAELGVAILLFAVGIETDFHKMVKMKGTVIGGSVLQVFITAAFVFLVRDFFGLGVVESVYLGLILAFSSTVIGVKILTQEGQVSTLHGRFIIGFAVVQDALAVLLLPLLAKPETILHLGIAANFLLSVFSLFGIAYLLNKFILPRVLDRFAGIPELFYLIIVSVCFFFISLSIFFNFNIAVGAFIGGISLSSLPYNVEASSKIRGLRDFFSTIFFVSIGMQLSLGFGGISPALLLAMVCVVYILNPLVYFSMATIAGYGGKTAFLIGMALAQAGEFSFIVASQGLALGQISQPVYNMAMLVIAISIITTPYLMQNSGGIYSALEKIADRAVPPKKRAFLGHRIRKLERLPDKKSLRKHMILVGAGIFGAGLVPLLKERGTLVIVDHNPHVIADLIKNGNHAIYGSPDNEDVWDKVSLGEAKLLLITIPNTEKAAKLIKKAKKENKEITVFARAHYNHDALQLYNSGADFVCMPHIIGANLFIRSVAEFLDTGKLQKVSKLQEEYMGYLKEKAKEEKKYFGI